MGRLHYLHHSRAHEEAYGDAAHRHGVSPMWDGQEQVDCERHLTEEFIERTIDFVDAPDERPFFAMVAFNAVHNFTWQLPQHELDARGLPQHPDFDAETAEYVDWYDGAIEPNLENGREYYLAQLEIMDREIGRLRAHLQETGQRRTRSKTDRQRRLQRDTAATRSRARSTPCTKAGSAPRCWCPGPA